MTQIPYSYVTLRYVHDMTTREFVNVGVVVFSPDAKFVGAKVCAKSHRVQAMFPDVSVAHLANLLSHIQAQVEILRTNIGSDARTKSAAHLESLVTSILPRDESSFQWGQVGGGTSADPRATLEALFQRFVMKYERSPSIQRVVIKVPVYVNTPIPLNRGVARTALEYPVMPDPAVISSGQHQRSIVVSRSAYRTPAKVRRSGDPVSG
jgi:hypothetical protein